MIEFLSSLTFWHWGILAILLVVAEMMLPGVVFLWVGIGASVTAVITFIHPDLPWEIQLVCFAGLAVVAVVAGRIWISRNPIETDKPLLNQRGQQNVGRVVTIVEPIVDGVGSAHLDDTVWRVSGDSMEAGAKARVKSVEGSTLVVEAEQPSD